MKTEIIKAIFTNLLFVIGVILMVIGFIRGIATTVNTIVFEEYPLDQYQESRCSVDLMPIKSPAETTPTVSQDNYQQLKADCEASLVRARRSAQVNDITYSIGFFVSGLIIALVFKRFIFTSTR